MPQYYTALPPPFHGPCRTRREAIVCASISLYALAIAVNLAIFIYGFDYYKLSAIDRPFSPKHHLLRPSGPIGLYLGFFGVALFVGIFLYPYPQALGLAGYDRKHAALARHPRAHGAYGAVHRRLPLDPEVQGLRRHGFLDHVCGVGQRRGGPLSLRADPAQGDHGRTLDARIAGSANSAGAATGGAESCCRKPTCEPFCACPTRTAWAGFPSWWRSSTCAPRCGPRISRSPVAPACRARKRILSVPWLASCGPGIANWSGRFDAAAEEAALSKSVLFLSRSQKVFHLWHVVHKPFSYAFAVLALMHIGLQFVLGYF